MLDFKKLKQILIEIEKENLFNEFINNLFDYEIIKLNKCIIRYKINNDFIIDIFDYNNENKFIRYYFTMLDNNSFSEVKNNIIVKIINLKKCFNKLDKNNKLYLFSSLFYEKDKKQINNILNKLFNKNINKIIKNIINL